MREEAPTAADDDNDDDDEARGTTLADAASASPLRISVVSGDIDRARIQGAAWHRGQEGRGSVVEAGGGEEEIDGEEAFGALSPVPSSSAASQ